MIVNRYCKKFLYRPNIVNSSLSRLRLYSSLNPSFNVAIVGSGPSSFYLVDEISKLSIPNTKIHIFEKLPFPYGLVRYGVAPDHPEVKVVDKLFENFGKLPHVSYFGNVEIGKTISFEQLYQFYNSIFLCYGAQEDKKIGIPGENLSGIYSAKSFVEWYNGHPEGERNSFNLSGKEAVIIGNGNVAIDIARILVKKGALSNTDISYSALANLKDSKILKVHIVGRRGPLQAAFTTKELRELKNLDSINCLVPKEQLQLSNSDFQLLETDRARKRQYQLLESMKEEPEIRYKRNIYLHFFKKPVEFVEDSIHIGKLGGVKFEITKVSGLPGKQVAVGTGKYIFHQCNVAFVSIGYNCKPLKGVPFDEKRLMIPNTNGAIEGLCGVFVSGWLKRGPTGIIATNKYDAQMTVQMIKAQIEQNLVSTTKTLIGNISYDPKNDIESILKKNNVKWINFDDWLLIEKQEIERGKSLGKVREKFTNLEETFQFLDPKKNLIL